MEGDIPWVDRQPEHEPRARGAGLDAKADGGIERVLWPVHHLDRLPGALGPLDIKRRNRFKTGGEPVVTLKCRLDYLPLHFTVERDGDLARTPVVAHADQRILFGQLA